MSNHQTALSHAGLLANPDVQMMFLKPLIIAPFPRFPDTHETLCASHPQSPYDCAQHPAVLAAIPPRLVRDERTT
jgi:hypothetical protein